MHILYLSRVIRAHVAALRKRSHFSWDPEISVTVFETDPLIIDDRRQIKRLGLGFHIGTTTVGCGSRTAAVRCEDLSECQLDPITKFVDRAVVD